jgi:hypothetical protein
MVPKADTNTNGSNPVHEESDAEGCSDIKRRGRLRKLRRALSPKLMHAERRGRDGFAKSGFRPTDAPFPAARKGGSTRVRRRPPSLKIQFFRDPIPLDPFA